MNIEIKKLTSDSRELQKYRHIVIFARHDGKWLYVRHKGCDSYETAGGTIESRETSETLLDCAKRKLREETGAVRFSIFPAFDDVVHFDAETSYGQVFYADVETLDQLSSFENSEFEIEEVRSFCRIPDKMSFPQILSILYEEMDKWLGRDKVKDEYWNLLDENRNLTGRKHRRIDELAPGDFHLTVRAWMVNRAGEFLITRRAFDKIGNPGKWEVSGGSVIAGEESLEAALREVREECGLALLPENAKLFSTYRQGNSFYDNWLFRQEFDLSDVVLQEGETIEARAASWREIAAMMTRGEFVNREAFQEFELLKTLEH